MNKGTSFIASLAIIIFFSLSNSCKKICKRHVYNFESDQSIIQPDSDSLRVGDTLFFSSIIPTTFSDVASGAKINYGAAVNFGSDLGIHELIGINNYNGAVSSFNYTQGKGQIYTDQNLSPTIVKQLRFVEENGYYKMIFAMIALKPGIFSLSIGNIPNIAKDCDRASVTMSFDKNMNKNLHYLKDIYYGGEQVSPSDSVGTFSFKVY